MPLTVVEVGTMIKGYEKVAAVVRQEFYKVMDDFPVCSDPRERRREFLDYLDKMLLSDIDDVNLHRYRQLCHMVENLYDLSLGLEADENPTR